MSTVRSVRFIGPMLVVAAALTAGVWLTAGGWHQRALVRPVPGGLTAVGHVVDYHTHRFRGESFAAVVQYQAADGQTVQITAPPTAHRPVIGAAATVSYRLLDPWHGHDLSVRAWTWQWPFFTGLLIDLLLAALIGHAVVTVVRVRRVKQAVGGAEAAAVAEQAATQVARAGTAFQVVLLPVCAVILFYTVYENTGRLSSALIAVAVLVVSLTGLLWLRSATRRRSPTDPRDVRGAP